MCREDNFIKDRNTTPHQACISSLRYDCQFLFIAIFQNGGHFLCCLRSQNYLTRPCNNIKCIIYILRNDFRWSSLFFFYNKQCFCVTQCRIRQSPVSQSHIYELNEMFEIIVICHVCFSSTKEKSWSFPWTITRVKIHQVHYNKVIWNKVKVEWRVKFFCSQWQK